MQRSDAPNDGGSADTIPTGPLDRPHPNGYRASWPRRAVLGWAVLSGGLGLVGLATGTALFARATDPLPVALNWYPVAVAAAAGLSALLDRGPVATRPLRRCYAVLCGLSVVTAFGLLMDLITLAVAQRVDSAPAAVAHAAGMVGVVVLGAAARSGARAEPVGAEPSLPVRLAAYAGAAAFLPYATMKTVWALGGTFAGISGARMVAISARNGASGLWLTLESYGLDATALLAALGVLLLFALVRPWGRVFPRWVPLLRGRRVPRLVLLVPALLGTATLAPYGVVGVADLTLATAGVVPVARGELPTAADALLVSWIGLGAFAAYGVSLAVAARWYWRRTR
jgi:D-alanyl-D-alanine dipeptidase